MNFEGAGLNNVSLHEQKLFEYSSFYAIQIEECRISFLERGHSNHERLYLLTLQFYWADRKEQINKLSALNNLP